MEDLKIEYAKRVCIETLESKRFRNRSDLKVIGDIIKGDYFYILADTNLYYCIDTSTTCVYYNTVLINDDILVNSTDKYNYYFHQIDNEPKRDSKEETLNRFRDKLVKIANDNFIQRIEK